jgi:hypothetical protein
MYGQKKKIKQKSLSLKKKREEKRKEGKER